ncbi:hypothetical protein ACHAWF_015602 [Thalassiosira exigua]
MGAGCVDGLEEGLAAGAVRGAVLVIDDQVAVARRRQELHDDGGVAHADRAVGPRPGQQSLAQRGHVVSLDRQA